MSLKKAKNGGKTRGNGLKVEKTTGQTCAAPSLGRWKNLRIKWPPLKTCWREVAENGQKLLNTYAFFLLFHAARHLRHGAVDGRVIREIRKLLGHVDGHGLGRVQGARPEEFAHVDRVGVSLCHLSVVQVEREWRQFERC